MQIYTYKPRCSSPVVRPHDFCTAPVGPGAGRLLSAVASQQLNGELLVYRMYIVSALCPLSPPPPSRPPKRRDQSTPPPDGSYFPIPEITEPMALIWSIAVHTSSLVISHLRIAKPMALSWPCASGTIAGAHTEAATTHYRAAGETMTTGSSPLSSVCRQPPAPRGSRGPHLFLPLSALAMAAAAMIL